MKKRNIITTLALAATLALGSAQLLLVAEANASAPPAAEAQKKKGNGFARAISAPFRALARVFGGGGRKDEQKTAKLQRVSEKDFAAFESAPMVRVSNNQPRLAEAGPAEGGGAPSAEVAEYLALGKVAEARQMLAHERFGEAIALLSSAASLAPNLAEAQHLLGYAYDRKGLRQLSTEAYERALKLTPKDAQLLNNYGHTLFLRGDYKAAKDRLKKAAKLAPGDERIWNNLALVQAKLEDYDDAFKSFTRAGGEFKGRLNVANVLERAGRDHEALKHYEAARRLNPTSRALLQHLADVYHRVGRREEAEAARQAIDGLTPKQDKSKGVTGGGGGM